MANPWEEILTIGGTGVKRKFFGVAIVVLCLAVFVSGCTTATISKKPSVEILFHQNPATSGVEYQDCLRIRITNPPQGEYLTVYVKFILMDSEGRIIYETTITDVPIVLSPGDAKERSYTCRFGGVGQRTLAVLLVTPGPDGVPGTPDDVTLSEDQTDFEVR
jgi:hypothetical protein